MDRDLPAPAASVGQAHGDVFGVEAVGNKIGDAVRSSFVGFEPCSHSCGASSLVRSH
jgi:pyrimidine deaminase RibD-like protein